MKVNILSLLWQHTLLLVALYVMTLGVALCVRSMLGSSVISVLPYVFQEAGACGKSLPLTIGQYTYIMNAVLVVGQILVLRRRFMSIQLLQLVVGFVFGSLLDLNMWVTSWLVPTALWAKILSQLAGCSILGAGIAMEVRCGSITMPGEGFPVAISRVLKVEFPKAKIAVDISLVVLGIIAGYVFFGSWMWHIIGVGTLFAMYYVGWFVKLVTPHLGWVDRLLALRPDFRRYIYGLAKYIYLRGSSPWRN